MFLKWISMINNWKYQHTDCWMKSLAMSHSTVLVPNMGVLHQLPVLSCACAVVTMWSFIIECSTGYLLVFEFEEFEEVLLTSNILLSGHREEIFFFYLWHRYGSLLGPIYLNFNGVKARSGLCVLYSSPSFPSLHGAITGLHLG